MEVSYNERLKLRLADIEARIYVAEMNVDHMLDAPNKPKNWFEIMEEERRKIRSLKIQRDAIRLRMNKEELVIINYQRKIVKGKRHEK